MTDDRETSCHFQHDSLIYDGPPTGLSGPNFEDAWGNWLEIFSLWLWWLHHVGRWLFPLPTIFPGNGIRVKLCRLKIAQLSESVIYRPVLVAYILMRQCAAYYFLAWTDWISFPLRFVYNSLIQHSYSKHSASWWSGLLPGEKSKRGKANQTMQFSTFIAVLLLPFVSSVKVSAVASGLWQLLQLSGTIHP